MESVSPFQTVAPLLEFPSNLHCSRFLALFAKEEVGKLQDSFERNRKKTMKMLRLHWNFFDAVRFARKDPNTSPQLRFITSLYIHQGRNIVYSGRGSSFSVKKYQNETNENQTEEEKKMNFLVL